MKEITIQPGETRAIKNVAEELKIFEGISHKYLVKYYGVEIHRVWFENISLLFYSVLISIKIIFIYLFLCTGRIINIYGIMCRRYTRKFSGTIWWFI